MAGIIITNAPPREKGADLEAKKPSLLQKIDSDSIDIQPVSVNDHIRGDVNTAEAIIVEYSDLECPFCKNFHRTLQGVMEKYPGKVAWVYRHFPLDSLHSKARIEARATECAASLGGNDAFWSYLDMIFENTPSNDGLAESQLYTFAENINLSKQGFKDCMSKDTFDLVVEMQYQDGVRAGVQGTPHSIILTKDGRKIPVSGADEKSLLRALDLIITK